MANITVNPANSSAQIAAAIAQLQAGEECVFSDGLYTNIDGNGTVVYATNPRGTQANPTAIRAATKYGAVIDGRYATQDQKVFWIYNSPWLFVDGFESCNAGGGPAVPDVDRFDAVGLMFQNNRNSVLQNCYFHHNGSHLGIKGNTEDCVVREVYAYRNGWSKYSTGGTTHQWYFIANTDLLFEQNVSEEGCDSFIHLNSLWAQRCTMRNNLSLNDGGGSDCNDCADTVWENNLFLYLAPVRVSSVPMLSGGSNVIADQMNSNRTVVKNNTMISKYQVAGISMCGNPWRRLYPVGTAVNWAVFNNIVIIKAGSPTSQIIEDYGTGNVIDEASNFKALYSDLLLSQLFTNPTTNFGLTRPFTAQQVFDLGYWNLRNDPRTVGKGIRKSSTTNGDIIALGNDLSPTEDIRGVANTRPIPNPGGTYDIGAYQYASGTGEEYKWPYWCLQSGSPRGFTPATGWSASSGTAIEAIHGDPIEMSTSGEYAYSSTNGAIMSTGLEEWPTNYPQDQQLYRPSVDGDDFYTVRKFYLGVPILRFTATASATSLAVGIRALVYFSEGEPSAVVKDFYSLSSGTTPTLCELPMVRSLKSIYKTQKIIVAFQAITTGGATVKIHKMDMKIPPLVSSPALSASSASSLSTRGRSARRTTRARSRMSP